MPSVTLWLTLKLTRLMDYLNEKKPSCSPSLKLCIFMYGVHAFALETSSVFKYLHVWTKILSQQLQELAELVSTYCEMTHMAMPLTPEHTSLSTPMNMLSLDVLLSLDKARSRMDGLGPRVLQMLDSLDETDLNGLV